MLSDIPKKLGDKKEVDKEILRAAMIAELDAINLYQQMADRATSKQLKKVLLDIAREEKTHVAEFETMLLKVDKEQEKENWAAKKEIKKLIGH